MKFKLGRTKSLFSSVFFFNVNHGIAIWNGLWNKIRLL